MHVNSSVAICMPEVELDDGGAYRASPAQSWIYDNWLRLIDRVKGIAGDKVLISVGDMCEGDKKDQTYQIITRNPATVVKAALDILKPMTSAVDSTFVVRGTAAHVGKSGNLEEIAAYSLDKVRTTDSGLSSFYHLPLSVDDVLIDTAHHCTMGRLPWTRNSSADRYAHQVFAEYSQSDRRPPHLVFRGHQHRWADSYDANPKTRVVCLPAWTLATEYTNKIAPGALAEIGAAIVYCDDGKYEIEKFKVEPRKPIWVVA